MESEGVSVEEFERRLERSNLSKKRFAQLVGMSYGSVLNWNNPKSRIPDWVASWLDLYEKWVRCEELVRLLRESGVCDKIDERM